MRIKHTKKNIGLYDEKVTARVVAFLRSIKIRENLTQIKLAEKLEVTKYQVCKLLNHKSQATVVVIRKCCLLGANGQWIMEGRGEMYVEEEDVIEEKEKIIIQKVA